MPDIKTCLTFKDQAEDAVNFYVSLFKNSRILGVTRVEEGESAIKGKLVSALFELEGQQFMAVNGGPAFSFAQGISLLVSCDTQADIDRLWNALSAGGEPGPCGWLTDRFGVSWQIVPVTLGRMLNDKNTKKTQNVLNAMVQMNKLDIATLEEAYEEAA